MTMRKATIFLLVFLMAMTFATNAKASTKVGTPVCWTVPAVYTPDQEVTFYYDVTDVGFPEGVDLYLWAWQPTEPDAGNGDNSSDFAKLTYLGNNIYSKTMVPTEYFKSSVESMTNADWPGFWQQLKTKRDDLWSTEFAAPDSRSEWEAIQKNADQGVFVYSGKKVKNFTDKWTLNEPLTFVFNPKVFTVGGKTMEEFAKTPGFGGFKIHSGMDDWTYLQGVQVWIPACMEKTNVQKLSNGYYTWSMTSPFDYYVYNFNDDGSKHDNALESDYEPTNIAWLMVGIVNNDWGGTCADQSTKAGQAVPYPDPSFSYFPTKLCANDILTLTRQYNGKLDGDLNYKIVASNKELTGVLTGNRDKRSISINLLDDVADKTISDLKVTITNVKGVEVVNTTIPLVPMSEVK